MAYVASYIPKGQAQYVAYTTAQATGKVLGTITRPDFELGAARRHRSARANTNTPSRLRPQRDFDPTVTTTVAVDGNRDLTSFNLGTSYAGTTFNFVPNGSPVTVTRDVIRTASCNTCHDQLAFHGGYAHGMQMCVLCHQPQNADPITGNTLDLKVMAHKIHMGSQLPSVVGTSTTPGVPYQIAGFMNTVSNFSTVIDPADPRRCEVCHSQTTGAAQATAFLTTAEPGCLRRLPRRRQFRHRRQPPRRIPDGRHAVRQLPYPARRDALRCLHHGRARGAHRYGGYLPAEPGYAARRHQPRHYQRDQYLRRTNAHRQLHRCRTIRATISPYRRPGRLQFTMAGPTTDYGYTSFGSDTASTPGYVTESATAGDLQFQRRLHVHLHACHSGGCHRNVRHRRGGAHDGDGVWPAPTSPAERKR